MTDTAEPDLEDIVSVGREVDDAESSGWNVEPITGFHPLAWVAGGLLIAGVVFTLLDTSNLVGNLAWWHWLGLVVLLIAGIRPLILHRLRLILEMIPRYTGTAAWVLAWIVFIVQLFNVITRYGNEFVDRDILIGQTTSVAWQAFGLILILGMNNGVKTGVNPRIDFWWANLSNKAKAWLDFVLHTLLLAPFTLMATRILLPYAKISLGQKRTGDWPSGWRIWETWEQSGDADQLAVGPIRALLFVAFFLFGLQIVSEIIKTGFGIMGREDLSNIHQQDSPLRVE